MRKWVGEGRGQAGAKGGKGRKRGGEKGGEGRGVQCRPVKIP